MSADYEKLSLEKGQCRIRHTDCQTLILIFLIILAINVPLCYLAWYKYLDLVDRVEMVKKFDEHVAKHGKEYKKGSAEYAVRLGYFKDSLKEIDRLNRESKGPKHLRARYRPNQFSDLSKEEFAARYLSGLRPVSSCNHYNEPVSRARPNNNLMESSGNTIRDEDLPKVVDWRTKGAVGPIEDQGQCGACWAFSTVGVIESFIAIRLKYKLPKLSVQQVLDCVGGCNSKCNGGDPAYTMNKMFTFGNVLVPESEYPLELVNETCRRVASPGYMLTSSPKICNCIGKEGDLKRILATHGPVAVSVNAMAWQNYNGGIIQNNCEAGLLNHAVQIVGYNEESDIPYYIVKNSWGTEWNDLGGYVNLAMYRNECGLATSVTTPMSVCEATVNPYSDNGKGKCV